jgi:hypothetical protein
MKQLKIAGVHYEQLKAHLFPGDENEAVAVALCGRLTDQDNHILTVMELMLIPYDACEERTPNRVTWPTAIINSLINRAKAENLSIVKIHCHPGGGEFFSEFDNKSDSELFEHLFAWMGTDVLHGSCIMLPDGRLFGRFFDANLRHEPIAKVKVVAPDFIDWNYTPEIEVDEAIQKRNLQAFGKGTVALLRRMKIGVVGCSGTGSPVLEQLKRLGVGELVVVDPDYIDIVNLNRIIGSTREDAEQQLKKTALVEREVAKAGFGTKVTAFASDVVNRDVVIALASCDVIFSCVDGVEGRYVLNLISSYYLVPLFDLGVKLEADGKGGIEGIFATVHIILPGGSSLLSRGQISLEELQAASIKRTAPEEYHRNEYLVKAGEDSPAVISVNMLVAAYAVNELLARIHRYRYEPSEGVDAIRIHFHVLRCWHEPHPAPCAFFTRFIGRGDINPLLNLIELGDVPEAE